MRSRNARLQSLAREMRRNPTPAEYALWQVLRGNRLHGIKFYHQAPISDVIVDFASRQQRVVIEVDGDTHADAVDYDARRTAWLEQAGFRVLRFGNADVLENRDGVGAEIERVLGL